MDMNGDLDCNSSALFSRVSPHQRAGDRKALPGWGPRGPHTRAEARRAKHNTEALQALQAPRRPTLVNNISGPRVFTLYLYGRARPSRHSLFTFHTLSLSSPLLSHLQPPPHALLPPESGCPPQAATGLATQLGRSPSRKRLKHGKPRVRVLRAKDTAVSRGDVF